MAELRQGRAKAGLRQQPASSLPLGSRCWLGAVARCRGRRGGVAFGSQPASARAGRAGRGRLAGGRPADRKPGGVDGRQAGGLVQVGGVRLTASPPAQLQSVPSLEAASHALHSARSQPAHGLAAWQAGSGRLAVVVGHRQKTGSQAKRLAGRQLGHRLSQAVASRLRAHSLLATASRGAAPGQTGR